MKSIKILIWSAAILFAMRFADAQPLNWKALDSTQQHIINMNAGIDYGATFGAGYGYQIHSAIPIVLTAAYSFPAGHHLLDDFKTNAGVNIRLLEWKNFCFSAEVQGVFRRYESEYVRLLNFGSDFSGTLGYYRKNWFVAGEAGFDKAIVTHFKNTPLPETGFAEIQDGWYEPSTGGNFYYGISGGYSFGMADVYLRTGGVIQQDFSTSPLLPLYVGMGMNWKLGSGKE